jgi:hypothetical protein
VRQDWTAWERDYPLRFLLVREPDEERGAEIAGDELELWAKVSGVEGLFVDPVPPPREVLTLRGCAPAGTLRSALESADGSQKQYGWLTIGARTAGHYADSWMLSDVTIIAQHPNVDDPSLVDVVIGAGVEEPDSARPLDAVVRFELTGDALEAAGTCQRVDGIVRDREPRLNPLILIGCELADLGRDPLRPATYTRLFALDRTGRVMDSLTVSSDVEEIRPSVLGAALVDITLPHIYYAPPTAARPIWETWYAGLPTELNQWAGLTTEQRVQWLGLARGPRHDIFDDGAHPTYHLDGQHVTDVPGLHLALGEALYGAGGGLGREWQGFTESLGCRQCFPQPFTLVWHDSDIARTALAEAHDSPNEQVSYFDEVVRVLRRRNNVLLQ